jgi:glycosyltransferase involved in cell wall biosynthesis
LEYKQRVVAAAEGLPLDFLGWRDDVYEILAQLAVVVVPSTREPGTTRVILEAFSCGLPVVAADSGGISEVLEDEETGLLVDSARPQALAGAVLRLLSDDRLRERVGRQALARWRERFTLERYQAEMLEVMRRAAGSSVD